MILTRLFRAFLVSSLCISAAYASVPANPITVYFNHPVDTSVGGPVKAVYLNDLLDDTLVAYINRSVLTLDIAVYNFSQNTQTADVAAAVNNAYNRGVTVRWIYNSSSANSGLSQLNPNIQTLASPNGTGYGIMHNKFMIIDAASDSDAVVWSGSMNWNSDQYNDDVNNVVIFRDKPLAQAFKTEFEEMWGSTTSTPDLSNSKFGPDKTNNTTHQFIIDGHLIECYFSPSDQSTNHLLQTLRSADSQLFFGVYTFTDSDAADTIINRYQQHGVYTAGIMDQYSQSFSAYPLLNTALGSMLKVYSQSTLYHNKMAVIDPCNLLSDPVVITGSFNWTQAADTKNDENLLIIHSADVASQYYQSFYKNFSDLGGVMTPCVVSGINNLSDLPFELHPNPVDQRLYIESAFEFDDAVIRDIAGRIILEGNEDSIDVSGLAEGSYILSVTAKGLKSSRLFMVKH